MSEEACASRLGFTAYNLCRGLLASYHFVQNAVPAGVLDAADAKPVLAQIDEELRDHSKEITVESLEALGAHFQKQLDQPTFGYAERCNYIDFLNRTGAAAEANRQMELLRQKYPHVSELGGDTANIRAKSPDSVP
jgi:hypothetical protein